MKRIAPAIAAILILTSCVQEKNLAPAYTYGVNPGVGTLGVHVIQPGDNLYKISQRYNLDLRGIIEANKLSPPYEPASGSRLNLPAPNTYTVRGKDNLYTVSRLFNTTQTELKTLNRLTPPFKLSEGQVLKIPTNYETATPSFAAAPPVVETAPLGATPAKVEAVELSPMEMPPQPGATGTEIAAASPAATNIPTPVKDVPAREGKFLKPVSGKVISSFGPKPDGQHNDGINIQAAKGDAVRSAENGQVVYVGNEIEGYGNMILLRHQDKYMTAYAHLGKSLVKKGDTVKRGQTIGTVGATGFVDAPQLHFEIRKGKTAIDPTGLI